MCIISWNSPKSISPSPFLSTSSMYFVNYCLGTMFSRSSPDRICSSSFLSIFPLLSTSNRSSPQVVVPQVHLGVQGGCDELRVVDRARPVCVGALEQLDERVGILLVAQTGLEFLEGDGAVSVLVEGLEGVSQLFDVIGTGLDGDSC